MREITGQKLLVSGILAGMLVLSASAAHGAVIAEYQSTSSGTLTQANIVDPNLTAGFARGASTNPPVFTNDFYASKPVMSISRSNDTALAIYVDYTITAAPGDTIDMDSWSFDGAAGGATGPRTYEVHSSVAGLARDADIAPSPPTSLASGTFTTIRGSAGSSGPMQTIPIDLSAPAYNNLTSLTMRIYFYTPTVSQNIDLDNITFNGIVNTPEPASLSAGLFLAAGTLIRGQRRER